MGPMTIVITGIAGFIGSRFAEWVETNHPEVKIIGIDSIEAQTDHSITSRVYRMYFRSLDTQSPVSIFEEHKPDYVFHFAAFAAEGLSPFMRKLNYESNIVATANVVSACINCRISRLVYTSSMAVYGTAGEDGSVLSEDTMLCPIDPYGIAKYACEQDIISAGRQFGLDWCIVRPHNVFGENQNLLDPYRNVLAIWMTRILKGEHMEIYGDGKQIRSFSYVDNLLPCLWQAAVNSKASREIINLGSKSHITLNEAANKLREVVLGDGYVPTVHYNSPRYEARTVIPSYKKSESILDYREEVSFEEGLSRMWQWAKTQNVQNQKLHWFKEYELKNVYHFWQDHD